MKLEKLYEIRWFGHNYTYAMGWEPGSLDPTLKYMGFKWNYLRKWSGVEIEIKKAFIIFYHLTKLIYSMLSTSTIRNLSNIFGSYC